MPDPGDRLHVTEGDTTLPALEVLTGRGFVTGKSGSGKSNTASVLVEELLDVDSRLLVVDTDGEYYGLKEDYEVLHLGATDRCDAVVGPEDAEAIADVALAEGVPVVLDVSGFLDGDDADRLVYEVAKQLFSRARDVRQPFLLLVEEVHEFVPEQGGLGEVGEMLVRVAKRGRKRGLGLCGLSQRPASVDKDFITQCDWLVWHRLTWANDTKVVDRILGGSYGTDVESLADGEAFLVVDWADDVERVQFRRKHTFDAGATPGYGEETVPDLRPVDDEWLARFRDDERAPTDSTGGQSDDETAGGTGDQTDGETADADSNTADGAYAGESGTQTTGETASTSGGGTESDGGGASDTGSGSAATPPRGEAPAADAKTAVWELGQLVAHLGNVAARRTARGLYTGGVAVARASDTGARRLGYWVRGASARAVAAVTDGSASTTAGNSPMEWQPGTPERPAVDRFVGASLVLAVILFVLAAYTLV
ncbi:MAG: helicase HerA domain-containing protein [Halobacterium sp.]